MAGTDVQAVRREYFRGACIPTDFTNAVVPPKRWETVVDGKKVTPKLIQSVLIKCRDAGLDLGFIAKYLGIGGMAILRYLENEKSIPETIARNFVYLFSSDIKIPKAPPEKPPIEWSANRRGASQTPKTADFDTSRLAERFKQEREKRGKEYKHVAWAIKTTSLCVRRAEEGKIRCQYGPRSVIFRLCNFYGIDIHEYETKPRINYKLYQKKIKSAKNKKSLPWRDVADLAGISERLLRDFLCYERHTQIIYLSPEMEAVLNVLGIDKNEVLDRRT